MEENKITKCLECGGELKPNPKTGIPTCIYCGREYKSSVGDYSYDLQEIVNRRQIREFIQAEELCVALIQKQPESCEAYWQMLLSTLGVVYVTEEGVAKPTFFSYSYDERESIHNNEYYQKAIRYADSEQREYYSQKAEQLDKILKEFFNLVAKENSYDIFISFKQTTEAIVDGERKSIKTDDYRKAKEIYEHFDKLGYKVFFSPVSIGKDTGIKGEKYEPRILKALQTAKAMVLLGTKTQYLTAQWVENEWRRYLYHINKGRKKPNSLILGYEKEWPKLPAALKDKEWPSFDVYKASYLNDLEKLLSFVDIKRGITIKNKGHKVSDFGEESTDFKTGNVNRSGISIGSSNDTSFFVPPSEEREIDAADNMVKSKRFKDAISTCNAILQNNPNSARAYWIRFYAKLKANDQKELVSNVHNATDDTFNDFEEFLQRAHDKQVAYANLDLVISALKQSIDWKKQKKLYSVVCKYADEARVKRILAILEDRYKECANKKDFLNAGEIFESAKEIFLEDQDFNMAYTYEYAKTLLSSKQYNLARPHLEKLAGAKKDPAYYYALLRSRLGVQEITRSNIKFKITKSEEGVVKKVSELNIDEIIARTLICDIQMGKKRNRPISNIIEQSALHQIPYNKKYAEEYISLIISIYDEFEKDRLESFLVQVADVYLQTKSFKMAKKYYEYVVSLNENASYAHWGLLKCRLKVLDDNDLAKKKNRLIKLQEFQNAKNCANEAEYKQYMDVYSGHKTPNHPFKSAFLAYTVKQRRIKRAVKVLAFLLLVAISLYSYNGIKNPIKYDESGEVITGRSLFFDFVVSDLTVSANEIGEGAFESSKIDSVTLDSNVKTIGSRAFADCHDLTTVTFASDSSQLCIKDGAFEKCAELNEIQLYNVCEIGENVFSGCASLKKITLICSSNVEISDEAFAGLNADTVIYLPTIDEGLASTLQEKNPSVEFELFTLDAVQECIYYISEIGTVTLDNENLLVRAENAYEQLSPSQKTQISNINKLKQSRDVYDTLLSVSEIGTVTLDSEDAIKCAEEKYAALSKSLKSYIYNFSVLVDARAVYDVMYTIDNIGEITEEKEEDVYNVLSIYDSLTESQKASVSNYASLMNAISGVDSVMAGITVKRINEIGNPTSDIRPLELAIESYNSLKESQKPLVSNYINLQASIDEYGRYLNMFTYSLLEDGTYSISVSDNKPSGEVITPDSYNGIAVTTIISFAGCSDITNVKISDNVTTISDSAFENCIGLSSVQLSNSVTSIGNSAFANCANLASITIPQSILNIGIRAFENCRGLSNIEISEGLTSIGESAFYGCV